MHGLHEGNLSLAWQERCSTLATVNKSRLGLPHTPVCQDQRMPCWLPVPGLWIQSRSQRPDSSEVWIQYIVQSIEYTYQLSNWNLKKHMDNKTNINRDERTQCEYRIWWIYLNSWGNELILRPFLCPLKLVCQGQNHKVTRGPGWILILPIVFQ